MVEIIAADVNDSIIYGRTSYYILFLTLPTGKWARLWRLFTHVIFVMGENTHKQILR